MASPEDPGLTPGEQRALSVNPDRSVREYLAQNPSLTPELQRVLSTDREEGVRLHLALHPSLPPELQRALSTDPAEWVRWRLAQNPSLTHELQHALSTDSSERVLTALAENPALALTASMPVAFLRLSPTGCELLEEHLEQLDPLARASLGPSWSGDLTSLAATCSSLAPV